MASKKFDTNSLMKNFIPEVGEPEKETIAASMKPAQESNSPIPVVQTQDAEPTEKQRPINPPEPTKSLPEKEKTKPITFHMPESTNRRMMQYLYERKLAGEKITVTQILNDALIKCLDELGV